MNEEADQRDWHAPFARAEEAGQVGESFRILEVAAASGDTAAAFLLGQEYGIYAKPGWQDFEKAYRWFEIGSELGDVACTYEQGIALLKGLGIESSPEKGLAKIREAAKRHNEMALGFLLDAQWQADYSFSVTDAEQMQYVQALRELQ